MRTGIDESVWIQTAWMNRFQSLVLITVMAGFLALLGWMLWGVPGLLMLLSVALLGVLFNPSMSPRMVMRLYGATPISPQQVPELDRLLALLAEKAALPHVPQLYYVPSSMLNAFAVGSRHQAAMALTDGLLRQLNLRELAGVMAHEISHVRNNDLWVMGLADMFSRATSVLSLVGMLMLLLSLPLMLFGLVAINWLAILLLVFAPSLSSLAQLALSRTREYDADLNAAKLTGDPRGLASALSKIEHAHGGWIEQLILPGRRIPDPSLLRSHPDTDERVKRLLALEPSAVQNEQIPLEVLQQLSAVFGSPVQKRPRRRIHGLWY